jgi:hypothetical protein
MPLDRPGRLEYRHPLTSRPESLFGDERLEGSGLDGGFWVGLLGHADLRQF